MPGPGLGLTTRDHMATSRKPDVRLKVTQDHAKVLVAALRELTSHEVLVGFPDENADRWIDTGTTVKGKAVLGDKSDITNASLGYIHDNGSPEVNIPARPFMIPGITEAEDRITAQLLSAAKAVLHDPATDVHARLIRVGMMAVLGIKRKINEGVPPPLADLTLKIRAAKGRKGAVNELAARALGTPPGMASAKPLVDTGQMRNAVSFVIRRRGATKGG